MEELRLDFKMPSGKFINWPVWRVIGYGKEGIDYLYDFSALSDMLFSSSTAKMVSIAEINGRDRHAIANMMPKNGGKYQKFNVADVIRHDPNYILNDISMQYYYSPEVLQACDHQITINSTPIPKIDLLDDTTIVDVVDSMLEGARLGADMKRRTRQEIEQEKMYETLDWTW